METDTKYQMFNLINKEFTFDVDVSKLPCGLNGALYFVEMAADGGMGKGNNKAGAKYGTGYCDSQCPHDIKFINGKANVEGWNPSENDPNAGQGKIGACCPEMDIWEVSLQLYELHVRYTLTSYLHLYRPTPFPPPTLPIPARALVSRSAPMTFPAATAATATGVFATRTAVISTATVWVSVTSTALE
jgi:hypothetical protein